MPDTYTKEQIDGAKDIAKQYVGKFGVGEIFSRLLSALSTAEQERDQSLAREIRLRDDAAELLIEELVVKNGDMHVSFENQPMTKILAEWAAESFRAHPEAINYLEIQFGIGGEEHYEMVVRKAFGKMPAQVAAENKARAEKAESERDTLAARCAELEARLQGAAERGAECLNQFEHDWIMVDGEVHAKHEAEIRAAILGEKKE